MKLKTIFERNRKVIKKDTKKKLRFTDIKSKLLFLVSSLYLLFTIFVNLLL